jgi:hypothetical protein
MANTAAYNGFQQYSGTGSAPTYEQVAVQIAYNASAIYYGDPVNPDANGYVVVGVTTGASGNTQIAGVFVGCQYLSVSQKRTVWSNYWPGSDVASGNVVTGYIINDPNAKFVAQFGNVSVDQGYVNAVVGFNIGSPNTSNGISGAFLATLGTTDTTFPFRVISLVTQPPGVNGTEAGAYQKAIVAFNFVSTKALPGT